MRRPRLTRQVAAGAVALGVSFVLGVGVLASSARAQAPTVDIRCGLNGPTDQLTGSITDFPANETLYVFALVRTGDGHNSYFNSWPIRTDATGATTTPSLAFPPSLPMYVGFTVFRDSNGNGRWDPDVEQPLYRGDGTVTTCPETVTLSPK